LFAVILATVAGSSISVAALSDEESMNFYLNGIYYYDPDGNAEDCDSGTMPNTTDVTLIGDSLSVGAEKQIDNKLPGIDHKVRNYDGVEYQLIQVSKHFSQDVEGECLRGHDR